MDFHVHYRYFGFYKLFLIIIDFVKGLFYECVSNDREIEVGDTVNVDSGLKTVEGTGTVVNFSGCFEREQI